MTSVEADRSLAAEAGVAALSCSAALGGWHTEDRFQGCARFRYDYHEYRINPYGSTTQIGAASMTATLKWNTNAKATSWTSLAELVPVAGSAWGSGLKAIAYIDDARCDGGCQAIGSNVKNFRLGGPLAETVQQTMTLGDPQLSAATPVLRGLHEVIKVHVNGEASQTPSVDLAGMKVRCDRALRGNNVPPGCVIQDAVPHIDYSSSEGLDQFTSHVARAVSSGLPGRLTRMDPREAPNRAIACPKSKPCPAGKSCDEYPFASTAEGAASAPLAGRTFADCSVDWLPIGLTGVSGFSACMIDEKQNVRAGLLLAGFYVSNRVIDGDTFDVRIIP